MVCSIHERHLDAGAEVLGTNSFGGNRYRLASHNLEERVEEINRAAVALAREVAGGAAWAAGSMGPPGKP